MDDKKFNDMLFIVAIVIAWLVGTIFGYVFRVGEIDLRQEKVNRLTYQVEQLNSELKIYKLEEELSKLKTERSKH